MKILCYTRTMIAIWGALCLLCSAGYAQENMDPYNEDSQFAWGENVGWLNLEPGGDGGPGVEVTDDYLYGFIWGENTGWINLSPLEGGVENDGNGLLYGYAWGENVGWVNFAPENGGVFIDACGDFYGTAWGENIGWISFDSDGENAFKVTTSWVSPVDNIAPVTEPTVAIEEWYTSDANITLSTSDCGSGVSEVHYSLDGGADVIISGTQANVSITAEGEHTLRYWSVDQRDNIETFHEVTFTIDKTPPVIEIASPGNGEVYQISQTVAADYEVTDAISDVASITAPLQSGQLIDTSTPGIYSFTVEATDLAGNSSSLTHTYTIATDEMAPAISITSPVDGGTYQCQEMVLAAYTVTDEGSGVVSSDGTVDPGEPIDTSALGEHTFTVTATDHAGNVSTVTHTYTVVFNENIDPDNENSHFAWSENTGWINFKPASGMGVSVTDFAVTGYAWGENIGWINLSPAQSGVENDGTGQLSGYAWGENVGWINFSGVYIDACGDFNGMAWGENIGWINFDSDGEVLFKVTTAWTSPIDSISPVTEPAAPIEAWYTTDVSITLSTSDCGSGVSEVHYSLDGGADIVTSDTGATASIDTEGEHTLRYWSVDQQGNIETFHEVTFTVDKTSPVITISSPGDGAIYQISQPVSAYYEVTDAVSGIASTTAPLESGEPIDTSTPPGVYSFTVEATDLAGNSSSLTHTYTIATDDIAPAINITSPTDGGTYQYQQVVLAAYTVTDEGSGVASTDGTFQPGEPIDTSTLGQQTFTVTATDHAGNVSTVTHTYTVVFNDNIDPDDAGAHFAWSENTGWINFKPSPGMGVSVSDFAVTGYAWGENIGWINLSPAQGGVENDGTGQLSGYAWGENIGWINFAPTNGGVTVDPATGEFSGHAWGENIGWIAFRSTGPAGYGVTTSWRGDSDGDGVRDDEDNCPYDSSKTEPGQCGCGVADTDTDQDGSADCNDVDDDNDGITDDDETNTYFTDPLNPDTDGDGRDDGHEIDDGTNPLDDTSHTGIPSAERYALRDLYNSTNGQEWNNSTNWLSDTVGECGGWHGVICEGDHVTRIDLSSNNLAGTIPASLADLSSLKYLYLNNNQLTGTIPPELGNLANLVNLYLHTNQLSGSIPPELGNLSNAVLFYLHTNQLSGSIPPELGNMGNLNNSLTILYLNDNQLSGPIPHELGNLINLEGLWLMNNQLSGPIPPELGNIEALNTLYLHGNQLSGSIPTELRNLANLRLLYLSSNQLTNDIPAWLGELTNLVHLGLENNQFSGPIPLELGNLANLRRLLLSNNQLTGPIPQELGNLSMLEQLRLGFNQLTGQIPPELGNMGSLNNSLTILHLNDNGLTGPIPPELGNLVNLQGLWLMNNQLSGPIPPALGNLSALHTFYLGSNQLSGLIPPELGNLVSLRYLYLSSNQLGDADPLTDDIPSTLGQLTNLENLCLENNQLSDTIPPELGNLTGLKRLYLDNNQLTGSIPAELGNLTLLEEFHLHSNQLEGEIPSALTSLTNLQPGKSDFRYNALYTFDDVLRDLLNIAQRWATWESTQTIAPTNMAAVALTETSVELTWTAIPYTGNTGGYGVFYSTTSGGPYTLLQTSDDKTIESATLTGLTSGTDYYLVMRTKTNPHANNDNTVVSGFTPEEIHVNTLTHDADSDGMPDYWENAHGLDPLANDSSQDADDDALSNLGEFEYGTDPHNPDTDDDWLSDGSEVHVHGTDPTNPDTDGDGLTDGREKLLSKTKPLDADTDDDGLLDGNAGSEDLNGNGIFEPELGETSPLDPDTDNDGIYDGTERGLTAPETEDTDLNAGVYVEDSDPSTVTDPTDADEDDDGIIDGNEDKNQDGLVDPTEGETNPSNADSDGDGLYDGTEIGLTEPQDPAACDISTGAFVPDADPDTTSNPADPDTDGDGQLDGEEDADQDGEVDEGETGTDSYTVEIDIKPGSYPNCFNNDGDGVIPVAILGSAELDVSQIDSSSILLQGLAVRVVGKSDNIMAHIEDANGDGHDDLVLQIEDSDRVFSPGTGHARLTCNLNDGTLIDGVDEICIVP